MKKLILTLAFTFCLQAVYADEPVKLEMKFLVGKTYTQNMHMQQEMAFEVEGTEFEQKIVMDTRIIMAVAAGEKEGSRKIGITYDRISQSVDMNGEKMTFDSDKPDEGNQMMGAVLKGLVGKTFTLMMDADYKITDIQGVDKLVEDSDPMAAATMQKMLGKEFLEQLFNANLTEMMPGKPVQKGDSWDVDFMQKIPDMGEVRVVGKMTHNGSEKLDGVECVKLDNNLKMDIDLSGANAEANPEITKMGMRVENGKMTGNTWWDTKLGCARKATFTQTMTMTMKNPQSGEEMIIPMVQTIETTVDVK